MVINFMELFLVEFIIEYFTINDILNIFYEIDLTF